MSVSTVRVHADGFYAAPDRASSSALCQAGLHLQWFESFPAGAAGQAGLHLGNREAVMKSI
ncbi:hypothetical protein [Chromobacterium sp. IIBBL 290-4]|uniref:hypothetical protein n=1 Tax=Chromobacterium sp. IIBBL 290-4 TaxID=2953890 RepID=UPI0020B8A378|nr:hypothetical protein [Chromobacterium sp. IIBBL 290-4]UTH75336.1 hypothetical protein NKT35_04325 [Chromobacterium sp. IIBBL 290-4]